MAKTKKHKQGRIKPKVVFGFLIILGIAFAALAITYKGFIELTETRQSLSEPSQKLIKLNSILTDIYEAESNIRTYTLTQNEGYLSIYFTFLTSINEKVDSLLYLSAKDPIQSERINFISDLLARKKRVLNELLVLKRGDRSSRFYEIALEEVVRLEPESSREASVVTSVTTTTTSRRDSIINKPIQDNQQGVFSRLFSIFSKKEPIDTTITKLVVEVETTIDTLKKHVISPSDSLLNEVIRILTFIQEQQEAAQYNISTKELELLKSDKEIMDQIRTVVSLLEREELLNSYRMAEEVKVAVGRSTKLLLMLGGVAFLMVVFFTSLIFRDISKANYYRNQLVEAKLLAEKLLKIKEEFLANMSHEIRTPLSAIIGFTNQLKRSNLHDSQERYVDSLKFSSEHLLNIVNDILDLSKIEGGFFKFESIPFSPVDVAKETIQTFFLKAKGKGINLNFSDQVKTKTIVLGDAFRLRQILYNLVSNAIKFTEKGRVDIIVKSQSIDNENTMFYFEVCDTGIGIDPNIIDSLFGQFNQADTSTTRKYGGTGLGLTIVKKLTELLGGGISVQSKVGEGSSFTAQIPYVLSDHEPNIDPINEVNLQMPRGLRVAVIDDDSLSQTIITEMLKGMGVDVDVFDNPRNALKAITMGSYSIVLTDIQMPRISGFDLVKMLRDLNLNTEPPVIAVTASSTSNNQAVYAKAGFQGYLIKPFNQLDLYNTIAPFLFNGKDYSGVVNNINVRANGSVEYDISTVKGFSGDDRESLSLILKSFIDNLQNNIQCLIEHKQNANLKEMGEVAHRMKSAFRQLKVNGVAEILEDIENLKPNHSVNLEEILSVVEKETRRVINLLEQDLQKL